MTTETRRTDADISELLLKYRTAIRNRDAAGVMACYSKDAMTYDLAPPLAVRPDPVSIQKWFETWETPITSEPREVTLRVGGEVAFAYSLFHMTGQKRDGKKSDLWFRSTACLEREQGSWKIVHVHNSVPFAMDGSDKALLDLKP